MILLTRQGVRDLGRAARRVEPPTKQCDHKKLRWCCYERKRPCGHIVCPDCGLYFDVLAENLGPWIW